MSTINYKNHRTSATMTSFKICVWLLFIIASSLQLAQAAAEEYPKLQISAIGDTNRTHNETNDQATKATQRNPELSNATATSISSPQAIPQPVTTTKSVPVLRPSIEEVASELSRKYLNLERHKNVPPPASGGSSTRAAHVQGPPGADLETSVEAEQEIIRPANASSLTQTADNKKQPPSLKKLSAEVVSNEAQYVNLDTAANRSSVSSSSSSPSSVAPARVNQYTSRKRKNQRSGRLQQQQRGNEDDELYQCQQYLQLHSTAHQAHAHTSDFSSLSARLGGAHLSTQTLPCSCESGWHFAASSASSSDGEGGPWRLSDELSRVWLNCDNIQLIGSQLFAPLFEQQMNRSSRAREPLNGYKSGRDLDDAANEHTRNMVQFSQRDADLQVIYSQKFHYLRLSNLRSIDLSRNRLRLIKMDAFHGLENKLEFLNLANNLLGDSRAMHANELHGSQVGAGEKSIFFTDELNRLQTLKWLSLSNNQINQLGANVFIKQQSSSSLTTHQTLGVTKPHDQRPSNPTSELVYLDLSHNLLKQVPSDSIHPLSRLLVLKLNDNKIIRIDQTSRFPNSLQYLDLSGNLINIIRYSDLIDLPDLLELDLSNNQLKHLDQFAFVSTNAPALPPISISSQTSNNPSAQQASDRAASMPSENTRLIDQFENSDQEPRTYNYEPNAANIRRRRDAKETDGLVDSGQTEFSGSDQENDLDAVESIFSTITDRFSRTNNQATLSEEDSRPTQVVRQFNTTLKLNLSQNLFEIIPGDSLLKFPNVQTLDLSHNRIRKLDANYLCSIYNLVENLKYLDLSGNLLSLSLQQRVANHVQLNKLFGCLQKLEKLLLATNRLVFDDSDRIVQPTGTSISSDVDSFNEDEAPQLQSRSDRENTEQTSSTQVARLTIKFGDNFGSRNLNTLDLSDNRLDSFPKIEQVTQQPIVLPQVANDSSNRANLSQWPVARPYLEILNLNYNNINHLDGHEVDHLANLRELHLDFNKLTTLPVKFMRRFTSLDHFSAAGNRINSLEPLDELLERSMRTLRVLNLSKNRLSEWPKTSMAKQLVSGTSASINVNQHQVINDQPANGANNNQASVKQSNQLEFVLEELNLEGNLMTTPNVSTLFDQLVHMKTLRTLNLSYNLLNKVRSVWFKFANKNLQRLLLSGNKINNIDLGAFASNQVNELAQLNLDFNLLKELKRKTFDSLPRLRELNLAHNLIHTINSETFNQLNSLQVLRLNHNKLTSWKCEYFAQLCNSISGNINVDLSVLIGGASSLQSAPLNRESTQMSSTGTGAAAAASSLIELDLSHNSLSQLRANSVSVHTKLVRLDLSHNKLSFIPHDLFKATASVLNGDRQVHLISSLKYLNLAHNHIQTIDNINFKPLRNLLALDLSFNELQALGVDVVNLDAQKGVQSDTNAQRRLIVSNNLTSLLVDTNDTPDYQEHQSNQTTRTGRSLYSTGSWPALCKLRTLNLAHNSLSMINQSLLNELSPFVSFQLNLSHNYLDSESLPAGFFTKLSSALSSNRQQPQQQDDASAKAQQTFDLIFTLKLESLDLSHNRLSEWPSALLDNHYSSLESCNLAHNRIQHLPQDSNSMIQIKALNFEFNPLSRESSELLLFEQRSARHLNLAATRLYAIQEATADSDQYSKSVQQLKSRLVNQTSQLDLIRSISRPIEAPYLRHLNLSSNQLVWLAANIFDKMHSLQTLDLSNNQLTRLHLLSNQLTRVAPTLEYLDVSSNLFTSIDSTDFNQLSRIRKLDLSNLLSLQKMSCRFLSKLDTVTHLRLFNYPKLRQSISNLVNNLRNEELSDRYKQKIRNELIMSTIGPHCFRNIKDASSANGQTIGDFSQTDPNVYTSYKIEQLELELFNNFDRPTTTLDGDSFILSRELGQLLGSNTRMLKLFGLNLTALSDTSLLGITSDDLDLQISYTSISQLPLREILSSLAKKTRLKLDLTHNNIQSIDMDALQWLDELQQMNLATAAQKFMSDEPYSSSTLKLAANPFRCDCQTRPLWLWLNQRHDNMLEPAVAQSPNNDEQGAIEASSSASINSNFWSKFHTITQANDLKCFYPSKLRGKLAQHVYYNDLVCKGSTPSQTTLMVSNPTLRGSRKRNETARSSETYYITSTNLDELEDLDDDDYSEFATDSQAASPRPIDGVRITRFNRYPSAVNNLTSLYFLTKFPTVPFAPDQPGAGHNDDFRNDDRSKSGGIGKRDQNSVPSPPSLGQVPASESQVNTKYTKHRPNTHQKHSHFSTMTNLNNVQFGRANKPALSQSNNGLAGSQNRNSMLTDSDIMILTVASIAMTLMSLVIISVCLFKYKFDHNDEEQILSTHSKFVLSQALFSGSKTNIATVRQDSSGSSSSGSASSKRSSKSKRPSSKSSKGSQNQLHTLSKYTSAKQTEESRRFATGPISKTLGVQPRTHLIAPLSLAVNQPGHSFLTPSAQNFLMRSPTIRRMHGLAHNATDWFKYTLRAYPTAAGARRRRLFIQNNSICGPTQLSTTKMANRYNQHKVQQRQEKFLASSLMLSGCPSHGIKCLEDIASGLLVDLDSVSCMYCVTLAKTIQQTKVLQRARRAPIPSSDHQTIGGGGGKRCAPLSEKVEVGDQAGEKEEQSVSVDRADRSANLTFQATIEQQGGFMPPKMIQALARRLDERHNVINGSTTNSEDNQASPLHANVRGSNSFYSRDQQSRSMRTFGHGNMQATSAATRSSGSSFKASSEKTLTTDLSGAEDGAGPSQIPTIDVDGRFAYQSDSHIDSPRYCANVVSKLDGSRIGTHGGTTPTSTVATGQDDIFILIRDTPASESTRGSMSQRDADESRRSSARSRDHRRAAAFKMALAAAAVSDQNDANMTGNDEGGSSMMQDECSRTSSPIAYGFMRSSPSATTLSSNTATTSHTRYYVNKSPELIGTAGYSGADEHRSRIDRLKASLQSNTRSPHASFLSHQNSERKHLNINNKSSQQQKQQQQQQERQDLNNNEAVYANHKHLQFHHQSDQSTKRWQGTEQNGASSKHEPEPPTHQSERVIVSRL